MSVFCHFFFLFAVRRHRFPRTKRLSLCVFRGRYVRRLAGNMWAFSCLKLIRCWKHVATHTFCVGINIQLPSRDDLRAEWMRHCRNDAHQTDLIFLGFPKKHKERERMDANKKMSALDKMHTYSHEWDDMKRKIIAFCRNNTWSINNNNNNNKCTRTWCGICDGVMSDVMVWIFDSAGAHLQIRYFICVAWCFTR